MIRKKLGKSDECIPAIGQGTMGVSGFPEADSGRDDIHINAVRKGIDYGMTFIDTAEIYGSGRTEELVGRAVRGRRTEVFIASKVSPENLRYADVIRSCEKSLKRLGTDWIDLYQVHWPNPSIPVAETMEAMSALKEQGKIRYTGVSNFSLGRLREAIAATAPGTIVSNQVEYNLFDRSIERDLLLYAEKNTVSIIAYSPLDQGILVQEKTHMDILEGIASKHGKSVSQVILNWIISHEAVTAIPKALSQDHILLNSQAGEFSLDPADIAEINEAFPLKTTLVLPDKIKVVQDGMGSRKAYRTLEDALKNSLNFTPSPCELANDLMCFNEEIKPVRVRLSCDRSGRYDYDLIEGRIRYWAWVIAHGWKRPIPVLVR